MNDKLCSSNMQVKHPFQGEDHCYLLHDDLVPLCSQGGFPVTKINNMPRLEMRVCSRKVWR